METLLSFSQNRMWHHLTFNIPTTITHSNKQQIYDLFLSNIFQYHPISITECITKICRFYDTNKAIDLINKGLDAIKDSHMYSGEFNSLVVELEIYKSVLMLEKDDKDVSMSIEENKNEEVSSSICSNVDVGKNACKNQDLNKNIVSGISYAEKCVFEFKNIEMNDKVFSSYNFLSYKYYEKGGDYENCVWKLLKYMKYVQKCSDNSNVCNNNSGDNNTCTITSDVTSNINISKESYLILLEKLVKYSLISKNFYNFTEINTLHEFDKISPLLKQYFQLVQEGNSKQVEQNYQQIEQLFGNHALTIRKKVYYVGLINLCFSQTTRSISFKQIQDNLNVSDHDINSFLLEALGLGLLKGKIDGYNKMLYFSTIVPRCLGEEELDKMRWKFGNWRSKIEEVIEMMEK